MCLKDPLKSLFPSSTFTILSQLPSFYRRRIEGYPRVGYHREMVVVVVVVVVVYASRVSSS